MKKYQSYSIKNINETVELKGWINKIRNLGGLIFIELRNRMGIMQVVVRPDSSFYKLASSLKNEYVISVTGMIVERESKNLKMPTGEIEVVVSSLTLINKSKELPFNINGEITALEETRLKYRYLDLRREELRNNFIMRNKVYIATRDFLNSLDFIEVETPILCKSTPEGARDYLVPSRVNRGKFYALPQSPQLFKQLLMVAGFERYFQIAKCFRDEDLRADRQPEFTQIDVEMSFVTEEDVMDLCEKLVAYIFKKVKGMEIKLPLLKMKYNDAIDLYGSDKPDLRFEMVINDLTDIFKNSSFNVFREAEAVNAIVVPGASSKFSRKDIDKLTDFVKTYNAKALAYLKFEDTVSGSVFKFISEDELKAMKDKLNINNNDMVFIISGDYKIVKTALGALRCKLASDLDLIKKDDYKLLWVVDFPSFEWSLEENRFIACHHPFTMPKDSDVSKLITDKANCYSKTYDIVINGYEAGGGSIRIHDEKIQNIMFEALELSKEDIDSKFGWFTEALKYGCPPHGGFAMGLDRLTMLLTNTNNVKDVIAFPKTASASDLMCNAPSNTSKKQLEELKISIK